MNYLLSIAIGPVQDFIAAARRCRDLWYGSKLLSEVSRTAAQHLLDNNAKLIFPAPASGEELNNLTVANKLLAVVETADIRALAKGAERAARDCLKKAGDLSKMDLHGLQVESGRYHYQLGEILEFYAAWTPYAADQHRDTRRRVEELAAGRKTLRAFAPHNGEAGLPKSSLDGIREHVIKTRSQQLYQSNLKDKEWLDAIGIVKRFGGGRAPFDSTLDVAALPYVKGQDKKHPDEMKRYRDFVRRTKQNNPYCLLYEHESRQVFENEEVDAPELKQIRAKLDPPKPPYYCVLMGDGDGVGSKIGNMDEMKEHQEFSRKLSEFAREAEKLIDGRYGGCSIYCGGDDVLALLPLHTALECAKAVNELFRRLVGGVTFSAGLAVAHALEPLSEVLEWARKAEKKAKDKKKSGPDALCISVNPRSGGHIVMFGKWDSVLEPLNEVVELYLAKHLPQGLAHELRELAESTEKWDELHSAIPQLAAAIAKKKHCDDATRLVEKYVVNYKGLEMLYKTMLVARPFFRAQQEANPL